MNLYELWVKIDRPVTDLNCSQIENIESSLRHF